MTLTEPAALSIPPQAPPAQSPRAQETVHWPSILQFVLTLVTALFLFLVAAGFLIIGTTQDETTSVQSYVFAVSIAMCGVLLLPSSWFSIRRLNGQLPQQSWLPKLPLAAGGLTIFALPVLLFLGNWVVTHNRFVLPLLPFLHVLAVGIPVFWITYLVLRGLRLGSQQRAWGVFDSGLVLAPALISVLEISALLAAVILAVVGISSQTDLVTQLTEMTRDFVPPGPSPEEAMKILGPLIARPGFILSVLTFASVIVPLIEEAIKPIGVWLLAGKRLSPSVGFAAGALSGAGYALFENLLLTMPTNEWLFVAVARIGTSAVHILTASLMGWALVLAWNQGKYVRLGAVYLLAVCIHGLWNALSLTYSFSETLQSLTGVKAPAVLVQLGSYAPAGLLLLAAGSFAGLLWLNAYHRHKSML